MKKVLISAVAFVLIIGVAGCGNKEITTPQTPTQVVVPQNKATEPDSIASKALNATYNIESKPFTLVNGKSEIQAAPGSATKITTRVLDEPVIGDLKGDKINDAALILIQNPGGSGTFSRVAAYVSTKEGMYISTNTISLGDRLKFEHITIKNGNIIVNYLDRKEKESMATEPSVAITRTFFIEGATLTEKK